MNSRIILMMLLPFMFCACEGTTGGSTDDSGNERWPSATGDLNAGMVYYGDYYGEGTGLVRLSIADTSLVFDTETEFYQGEGSIMSLFLNIPLPQDANGVLVPEGEYVPGDVECTFVVRDDIYTSLVTEYDGNGGLTVCKVTGGKAVVRESSGFYWINCQLEIEREGEIISYNREFIGKPEISNNSDSGYISNLKGNVQCRPMTYAEFVRQGTNETTGTDIFSLFLATDYNEVEGSFDGDALLIYLNVSPEDGTVPSGTYTVLDASYGEEDLVHGTALPGTGSFETNKGTWFYSYDRQLHAQVREGRIAVVRGNGSEYSFTVSFKDGNGYSISASYNGNVEQY